MPATRRGPPRGGDALGPGAGRGAGRAVPPLAREVLGRLQTPRSTAELLDGVEAADSAVLQTVAMLHGEGLIVPVDVDAPPAPEPLLTAAEAHAVRSRAARGRNSSRGQSVKVLLGGA